MSQELMPCPFCGGKAKIVSHSSCDCCNMPYNAGVMCLRTECGALVDHFRTDDVAIAAWNTRPTAQAVAVDDCPDCGMPVIRGDCQRCGYAKPDATTLDDARDARLWRPFIANIDRISTNTLMTGTTEELIAAVEQAALEWRR